jgi:hypothetical protein
MGGVEAMAKEFYVDVEDVRIMRYYVSAETEQEAREKIESDPDFEFDYLDGTRWQILDVAEATP